METKNQLALDLSDRSDNLTKNPEAPEDFEDYMNWLLELETKNPEAYQKEIGVEVSENPRLG